MAIVKKGVVVIYNNVTARIIEVMESQLGRNKCVITSGLDGEHTGHLGILAGIARTIVMLVGQLMRLAARLDKKVSGHYELRALDFRASHLTDEARAEAIKHAKLFLGGKYYVEESNDGAIHVQLNRGETYTPEEST